MSGRRILALVAAVALGVVGGVAVGRATAPDSPAPAGLANSEVVEEHDQDPPVIYAGNERVASVLSGYQLLGFRLQQQGVAVQRGNWVAEPLTWSNGEGIAVYEIDADGTIAHQWVIGG